MKRFVEMSFNASLANVTFARATVASFFIDDELSLSLINEIKTIVSEAVTNCVVHGYNITNNMYSNDIIKMSLDLKDNLLTIKIEDKGIGIENIEKAKEPLFSTKLTEERAGLGFTIMEIFSDNLEIISQPKFGTTIIARKYIS